MIQANHEITVTVAGGVKGLILRCVQSLIQEMKSSLYSHVSFLMACVVMAGGTPVIVSLKEEDKFKLKRAVRSCCHR